MGGFPGGFLLSRAEKDGTTRNTHAAMCLIAVKQIPRMPGTLKHKESSEM